MWFKTIKKARVLFNKDSTNKDRMKEKKLEKEMKDYSEAVEFYASKRIDNVFFNSGNPHALVVFENIFKYATDNIIIVAKNLNNSVTNDSRYIDAIKSFLLKKNTRLEILVSEDARNESLLFVELKKYSDKITIKNSNGKFFKNGKGEEIHFCIADNSIYRLETNIKDRKASCNFNDVDYCLKLKTLFNNAFNSSDVSLIDLLIE